MKLNELEFEIPSKSHHFIPYDVPGVLNVKS